MKPKLLNLDPWRYSLEAKSYLSSYFDYNEKVVTREDLLNIAHEYDVFILRFSHQIDAEVISRAHKLKIIATNATGVDHIDEEFAKKNNIQVISLRGEYEFLQSIPSTAELTILMILSLIRNFPAACQHANAGGWDRNKFLGMDLEGKTLGILGFGRIGRKVAKYADAFGMKVIACDVVNKLDVPEYVCFKNDLHDFLSNLDILTIHIPFNKQTANYLNETNLNFLKKGAYIVNTSRSQILSEEAILNLLNNNYISGVGLDVLSDEYGGSGSMANARIREYARLYKKVIISPHIGGASIDSWIKTEKFIAKKIVNNFQF
jgi:D-3-phosphoglycerate dehydrogenase